MSNTDLYYAELTDLSVRIAVGLNNRRDPLDELTQALDQLSQTNSIKGKAADAMKAYISEVHMTLIQTLQLILFNYQAALGKYVTGYLGVDSDENFKLIEEDFAAHEHNLSSHRSDFTSIGKKLKAISDEAEDIVSLSGAGSKRLFNVADEMKTMKKTVSALKEKWDKYEDKEQGFGDVENLIVQTTSLLKNTLSVPRGYSYSPGSFSNLMSKNFVDAFEVNADYAQKPYNQKAFKANWDRICKNYKVDQKRMAEEKAKEETEKEGRRALIWDELQIAAGAALVVTGAGTGFGVLLIAGGVNGYINHTSMALTGSSFNIAGSLTNGAAQWYNKNIGEPLVKTGNPIAKVAAGLGNSAIETAGGMGQFNVYDIGKAGYTLYTNPQARVQFKAGLKNYWNKLRSGDAYTIGQTAGIVASVLVNPGDISAAAGKASKAESLLGKAGTFTKSIAVSSVKNVKSLINLPGRALDNLGNKVADLRTLFSDGKDVVGNFTNSVVVSGEKNVNSVLTKVKGKLRDVGTASGAFAKAFGETYVKESRKYANTLFGGLGAPQAGLEAAYKGVVAGRKEAKSALKMVKDPESGFHERVSSPNAKEIISERVNGLDLDEHQLTNKQLNSKKMSEIKSKIDNRTATKAEYETYKWNKKFSARRREGVKQFWNQERERIINGESTTRNWTPEQIQNILNGKTPKYDGRPIQGHHSYSASKYPHLADKGEIIYPVTPNEHLRGWHGGNFKNSNPGEPIIDINDF